MIPARRELKIRRGVSFGPIVLRFRKSDGSIPDLTGYTARAQYSPEAGSASREELGVSFDDAEAEATLELTDEETDARTLGTYRWDLLLVSPGGDVSGPYVVGKVIVEDVVTEGVAP